MSVERTALRDLLAWCVVPLFVLSLASTKRGLYLLPIYPAAAMLLAWWLCRGPRRVWLWVLLVLSAVLGAGVVAAAVLAEPRAPAEPLAAAVVLAAALALASRAVLRGDGRGALLGVAAVTGTALLCGIVVTTPRIVNTRTSARPAGTALRELTAKGAAIALYGFHEGSLGGVTFYSGRTYANEKSTDGLGRRLENGELILLRGDELEPARRVLPFDIEEAARWRCRGGRGDDDANDYVLLRRAAVAGAHGAPP